MCAGFHVGGHRMEATNRRREVSASLPVHLPPSRILERDMPSKPTPITPEFRSIGQVAAKAALDVADGLLKTTGTDPLKPHHRRELIVQAGGGK